MRSRNDGRNVSHDAQAIGAVGEIDQTALPFDVQQSEGSETRVRIVAVMGQLVTGRILLDRPAESPAHIWRNIHGRSLHQSPGRRLETGAADNRLEKPCIIRRRSLQARWSAGDTRSRPVSRFTKPSMPDRCIILESRLPDEAAAIHS